MSLISSGHPGSNVAQTIPPDNVAVGSSGHIAAHNNISDMLTLFQGQLAGQPVIFQVGTATLTAGSVTVPNGNIITGSLIFLSRQTISGTAGTLTWTLSPGTSFTINSSSASDAGVIAWMHVHF